MDYLAIQEVAEEWGISKRRIQVLCREGRIPGAKMLGNMWVIPENADKPIDARTKNPVKSEETQNSRLRRELKLLLRELYRIVEKKEITEERKRDFVLSLLATGLCQVYLDDKKTGDQIFCNIYHTLSGRGEKLPFDAEAFALVETYLLTYKEDPELDHIVSWAYQYSNKILSETDYVQTQFFTEKYMVDYLMKHTGNLSAADKLVDPCCGGGNFLVECLEMLCRTREEKQEKNILEKAAKLYGYDIDRSIARVALVNIRLKAMSMLSRGDRKVSFRLWDRIRPNIYCPIEKETIAGALAKDHRKVQNLWNGSEEDLDQALGQADLILTNPPFATVKGMASEQKMFLKKYYPDANCDTCVAFLDRIYELLAPKGACGLVSQNAWMHLKSFSGIRKRFISQYKIEKIVNLGSGAFWDLSGEKSNVSLLVLGKSGEKEHCIEVANLEDRSLREKIEILSQEKETYLQIEQSEIDGVNGFDFSGKGALKRIEKSEKLYRDMAVPMQGTSTGNAKKLVGFFWEHFKDPKWKLVSKGGGYCRWEGLNCSVVKWGTDGEYIKKEPGSALRNAKYFPDTQLVFSDTGTAGLNVRILLKNQIFIASGPGIRVKQGNEYAHMAFLNSRIASWYIRMLSPKLTIAAGYISQLPIKDSIVTSVILEKNAKLCVELKRKFLSIRPHNVEYDAGCLNVNSKDVNECAWRLFHADLENELLKLEIEDQIDRYLLNEFHISDEEELQIEAQMGKCAYCIQGEQEIEVSKLDDYLEKLLDCACTLKRTRTSKRSLGSDGILEFAAKDLNVNPEFLVKEIRKKPLAYKNVLGKYRNLLLHNEILERMGYHVRDGFFKERISAKEAADYLKGKYDLDFEPLEWLEQEFNAVHTGIFKGAPCLTCEKGEIKTYAYHVESENIPLCAGTV